MTIFAALALPALAVAFTAYGWRRRRGQRGDTLLFLAWVAVVVYGSAPYIVLQWGNVLRWEMLPAHLLGMASLIFVSGVAYVLAATKKVNG